MLDQVNEILEAVIEDEKMFPNVAKMLSKLYDALLDEGFTHDQAISIVANYKLQCV